ncbi:MAG: hypothetical protein IKT06_03240 [Aeriscardovia sp.]|nr:hypothetical protein [Aeriscardovia sp.]
MSRNREPAEIIRLREAERAYQEAKNSYNQRVKQGEKQLKQAQKAHEKAVESAQSQLEGEKESFAAPLDSFEGAVLYRTRLDFEGTSLKLDPALGCEVEVSGGLYTPPSGDEKTKDTREVKLHFFSPSGQLDITAPYEKEKQAHEFADEVTSAARDCIRAKEEYEKNVSLLEKGVQETMANTHAIDLASSSLAQDKAATQSMEAAKAYLEKIKEETPKEMLKTYKRGKAKKKLIIWSVIIIVCVIIIALLITWASGGFNK